MNTISKEKELKRDVAIDFSNIGKYIVKELTSKNKNLKYTQSQVAEYLNNPYKYEKELRSISRYFYVHSSHYRRTIQYVANMLTFDYALEIKSIKSLDNVDNDYIKKEYSKAAVSLDDLELKHEMSKASIIAWIEDTVYGYQHKYKDHHFLQFLDPDYCKLSSIEDGVYNFQFDFRYFDSHKDELDTYPEEFKEKYYLYRANTMDFRWQELDSDKQVCLKINEHLHYSVPPFAPLFEDIFDIRDYKSLKKAKTESENFSIIHQEVPLNEKSDKANDFKLDWDSIMYFHQMAVDSTPKNAGVLTSPMKINTAKFSADTKFKDVVGEAEKTYFDSAGIPQVLFGNVSSNSIGLKMSINVDEQMLFRFLLQIERWVNRKVKKMTSAKVKFKAVFLETTRFNQENVFERYLKGAQFGLPIKSRLVASAGLSPSSMINNTLLENDILELNDKFIPLKSTHTGGADGEGAGRNEMDTDELSDEGLRTRDSGANDNRA